MEIHTFIIGRQYYKIWMRNDSRQTQTTQSIHNTKIPVIIKLTFDKHVQLHEYPVDSQDYYTISTSIWFILRLS